MQSMDEDEMFGFAKEIQAPYDLVRQTAELGRLPVVNFAAGGIATPADAALMMQLGVDGVFVGQASSRAATRPSGRSLLSRHYALQRPVDPGRDQR